MCQVGVFLWPHLCQSPSASLSSENLFSPLACAAPSTCEPRLLFLLSVLARGCHTQPPLLMGGGAAVIKTLESGSADLCWLMM